MYTNYSYITCTHLELAFLSNVYFSRFLPCKIVALILLIWIVGDDGNQYVLTKYFDGICIHACMYASMSQNTLPATLRMHIFYVLSDIDLLLFFKIEFLDFFASFLNTFVTLVFVMLYFHRKEYINNYVAILFLFVAFHLMWQEINIFRI
jgi:hypothetical protein